MKRLNRTRSMRNQMTNGAQFHYAALVDNSDKILYIVTDRQSVINLAVKEKGYADC